MEVEEDGDILEFAPESSEGTTSVKLEADSLENAKKAGLNTDEGVKFCANDVPFYLEMLREFVSAQPDKEKTLNECYDNEDWKNYQIHVHALKSNLRSIGAAEYFVLSPHLGRACGEAGRPP